MILDLTLGIAGRAIVIIAACQDIIQAAKGMHSGNGDVAALTLKLRSALDQIADKYSEADALLDHLECIAGLVDENGKRKDEE